jgi:DNA-binding NarL/FixJ family response regulator
MPTPRFIMSEQRQILQLLHDGHISTRKIAAALHLSKTSVGYIAKPITSTLSVAGTFRLIFPAP